MSWQAALERTVTGLGYDLVDVERSTGGLLRVTIDRLPDRPYNTGPGASVLVEDCELVTRQLQLLFEVETVDYQRLEVSSPGLDRPLKTLAQWQRFVGTEIEVTLREPFQNRRKWRGTLAAGADDAQWRLVLPADKPLSRTASKRAAKAATVALAIDAAQDAASPSEQVLDFSLDEVRDARLVPLLDFKGRRADGDDGDDGAAHRPEQHDGQPPVAEKQVGGQD